MKMISDSEVMRGAMSPEKQVSERDPSLKRKAWFAAFAVSALFWVVVILMIMKFW